jgi:hypothetical protein
MADSVDGCQVALDWTLDNGNVCSCVAQSVQGQQSVAIGEPINSSHWQSQHKMGESWEENALLECLPLFHV